jgi:hypothetical protein
MVEIPDVVMVPRLDIRPNQWNPNEFDDAMFNELVRSIEEDGFIQPIVIAPLEDGEHKFEIIDGEHRFTALDLLEVPDVPCIIRDVDEDKRIDLTVKTYRLRGKFNMKKFTELVEKQLEKFSMDELAERFAFPDPDELSEMIENARDSLPDNADMRKEFDRAKDDIKTVDDLSALLNRLFTKYGDTLPAHFMVLDFGGKEHIWVQMERKNFQLVKDRARDIMAHGYTFDSFITHLLTIVPVERAILKYETFLEPIKKDDSDIDKLMEG